MRLIIVGNTNNGDIVNALCENKKIEIIGGIADNYSLELEYQQIEFFKSKGIPHIAFEDIAKLKPDICLVVAYSTLINISYFSNILTLNIHAGILPIWKGFHANGWAIINGEDKIGYTLHKVNEYMDGGDIFYQFIWNLKKDDKFGEIAPKIRQQITKKLPQILLDIKDGKIIPKPQKCKKEYFCVKIKESDGVINDWNINSMDLYNLYRVVSHPYGKGLFFSYKGKKYEIIKMSIPKLKFSYVCPVGAIVNLFNREMFVKTKDSYVKISEIRYLGQEIDMGSVFQIGNRL